MNDNCVVNVSVGGWYPRGLERLKDSIGYQGGPDIMGWTRLPTGAKPHAENNYGFKTWAIQEAAKQYKRLLWLDSACYAVKPLEPLFDLIRAEGYLFCANGWRVGQWCSDSALVNLGITREEALEIPELTTYCVGFDLENALSRECMEEWHRHSVLGTFHGHWWNSENLEGIEKLGLRLDRSRMGFVSADKRVLGHRHDQTALSVIAWKMGMRVLRNRPFPVDYVNSWEEPKEQTYIVNRGM